MKVLHNSRKMWTLCDMKRLIYLLLLSFGLNVSSYGDDDPSRCMAEIEQTFFQNDLVTTALSYFNIPQGLWVPINSSLQQRVPQIAQRMKKKTRMMVPDPLEYPMNTDWARKALKDTLFDVFREALMDNQAIGGTAYSPPLAETGVMQNMFNYIYEKQKYKFIQCFGPEKQKEKQ